MVLGEAGSRVDDIDGHSLQACQSELVQRYVKRLFEQRCSAMERRRRRRRTYQEMIELNSLCSSFRE